MFSILDPLDIVEDSGWYISVAAVSINIFVFLIVLLRTLVHGEPCIERQSKSASLYWRQRKQADYDMNNVLKDLLFCGLLS